MNRCTQTLTIIALTAIVALAGCVEVTQTMRIDGNTGTFDIVVSVPKDVAATVSKNSPYAIFFNTRSGAKHFNRPGLVVRNYRVFSNLKGDRTFIKIRGEITNLEKALSSGVLGKFSLKKGKKGKRLECAIAGGKSIDLAKRKDAFKGLSLKLAVSVPKTVHDTNGKTSGKTVTWDLAPGKLKDQTLYLEYE